MSEQENTPKPRVRKIEPVVNTSNLTLADIAKELAEETRQKQTRQTEKHTGKIPRRQLLKSAVLPALTLLGGGLGGYIFGRQKALSETRQPLEEKKHVLAEKEQLLENAQRDALLTRLIINAGIADPANMEKFLFENMASVKKIINTQVDIMGEDLAIEPITISKKLSDTLTHDGYERNVTALEVALIHQVNPLDAGAIADQLLMLGAKPREATREMIHYRYEKANSEAEKLFWRDLNGKYTKLMDTGPSL